MSTTIRAELSENNRYWIEKHRYYELKHFCLQYPIWKKAYFAVDGLSKRPADLMIFSKTGHVADPTARCAIAREFYQSRMAMVEQSAIGADPELANYILRGVTEGVIVMDGTNRKTLNEVIGIIGMLAYGNGNGRFFYRPLDERHPSMYVIEFKSNEEDFNNIVDMLSEWHGKPSLTDETYRKYAIFTSLFMN